MESKNSKNYSLQELASIAGCFRSRRKTSFSTKNESRKEDQFNCIGEKAFSFFYMIDFEAMEYNYISEGVKNILGYTNDYLSQSGVQFFMESIHPDDRAKLKAVHQKMFSTYYSFPIEERKNLKFDYNIRIRKGDQSVIHLLHQTTFVKFTDDGEPALDFTTCTDITRYKSDNNVRLTIYQCRNSGYHQLSEFDIPENTIQFTKRQAEIMELISQGLTSKQIADKLFISFDTVKNHRRKIISCTQSKNMAETMKVVFGRKN